MAKRQINPAHRSLMGFVLLVFDRDAIAHDPEVGVDFFFPIMGSEAYPSSVRMKLQELAQVPAESDRSRFHLSMKVARSWMDDFKAEWEKAGPAKAFAMSDEGAVDQFRQDLQNGTISHGWAFDLAKRSGCPGRALAILEAHELGETVSKAPSRASGSL